MGSVPTFDDLMLRWQEQRQQGRAPTPEELCADCPELLSVVRRQLKALESMAAFLTAEDSNAGPVTRDVAVTLSGPAGAPAGPAVAPPGYELLGLLGRGGMGVVYKARQRSLNRVVALKMISAGSHARPEDLARFRDEAEAVARLQHPNIVQVYETGTHDGLPFFSLEYVAGGSLDKKLAGRPQPPRAAAEFVRTLARAVHAAHQAGIVHRDLKPANILLVSGGVVSGGVVSGGVVSGTDDHSPLTTHPSPPTTYQPKITDFGLAKQLDAPGGQTRTGVVMGTPEYMAPEQARGRAKEVGPAADVYALGAILYELLTGRPPFKGETTWDTMALVVTENPVPLLQLQPKVPRDLETICLKCLRKEPARRYPSAEALADDLGRFLAGEPIVARPVSRWERVRKWVKRRPAAAGLAAVLVLLVLVGGGAGWGLLLQHEKQQRLALLLQLQEQKQLTEQARQRQDEDNRRLAREAERARRIAETVQDVERARNKARLLCGQARAAPVGGPNLFEQALAAARQAEDRARRGPAPPDLWPEMRRLAAAVGAELTDARRDEVLLKRLLDIHHPHEIPEAPEAQRGPTGTSRRAEPDVDAQYRQAFAAWGLDLEREPTAAADRIKKRPSRVLVEVALALDTWAATLRRQGRPRPAWQPLVALARAIDPDPSRDELRAILAADRLDAERLRRQARGVDPARAPVLGVLLLARALETAGDRASAEKVLCDASLARPGEALLSYELGNLLERGPAPRWPSVLEHYRAARAIRPELGWRLAQALERTGRAGEARALRHQMVLQAPRDPWQPGRLGLALYEMGDADGAVEAFRHAIASDKGDAWMHNNLGRARALKGDRDRAIDAYRQAIRLDGRDPWPHNNLGVALYEMHKLDAARAACRKAIALKPELAVPYYNLGRVLFHQGKAGSAAAAFRLAIRRDAKLALAHAHLGRVLSEQGDPDGALAACREAISLNPTLALPYYYLGHALVERGKAVSALTCANLGGALLEQGAVAEAVWAYRTAVALAPRDAGAHNDLGLALADGGDLAGAAEAYRRAIAVDPGLAVAHTNLGNVLLDRGDVAGAIAAYRQAVRLRPDDPGPFNNLGQALLHLGRFPEAAAAFRNALRLQEEDDPWYPVVAGWAREAERLPELERTLAAAVRGDARPADPADRLALARLCQFRCRRLYAASVRLYAAAFVARPRLADDLRAGHRYDAACAAALAAAGQGADAAGLTDRQRARFRQQALDWLRADLRARAAGLKDDDRDTREAAREALRHWRGDPDLAGVRSAEALAKLPSKERRPWQELWADLDAALRGPAAVK